MKRLLFSFAFVLFAIVIRSQGVPTHLSVYLDGIGDSVIFQYDDNSTGRGSTISRIATKNDSFDMTLDIAQPSALFFTDIEHSKLNNQVVRGVGFTLVPGENAVVTGTIDDYKVGGSKIYEHYAEVQAPMSHLFDGYGPEKFDSLSQIYSAYCLEYIKAHPDDEVGVLLLGGLGDDGFNVALPMFTPAVREGRLASIIENRKKQMEMNAVAAEAAAKIVEGAIAPDFALNTINGKPLQLSALRGKYVVLDFWGSWCAPCMNGMPAMKACYERHKGKLEMVSIDCQDTDEKWKETVKRLGLQWIQVREDENTSQVSQLYAVRGFPTKIVIDPNGQIVYCMTGEDPDLYTLLDDLLSK